MFQYKYKDLARYVEDMRLLQKYGGDADNKVPFIQTLFVYPAPENASALVLGIFFVINLVIYAFLIVCIYMVYYIIFKGYPKVLVNLMTFNMSHVANMDELITRDNVMFDAYNVLVDNKPSCASAYDIYQKLYGNIDLKDKMIDLDKTIQTQYSRFKYTEKYKRAFREYYYFFYKIITDGSVSDTSKLAPDDMNRFLQNTDNAADATKPITVGDKEEPVQHYQFYEAMTSYKEINGELDTSQGKTPGKKSNSTKIWEVYSKDRNKGFKEYNDQKTLKEKLLDVSLKVTVANNMVNTKNYLPYLVVPANLEEIKKAVSDCKKFKQQIEKGDIYLPISDPKTVPFGSINEFSWYYLEVQNSLTKGGNYSQIVGKLSGSGDPKMVHYMNLPVNKRPEAIKRLNMSLSDDTIEYINKYPIAAHIYFNPLVGDKSGFYQKVMDVYKAIFTSECNTTGADEDSANLMKLDLIGGDFKKLVNAINVMNLYLNMYRHEIIKIYEKKYMSNINFFMELWIPFLKDMVLDKIIFGFVRYWKDSWFGPPFPTKNWKKYREAYVNYVEKSMESAVKETWKRFFTIVPIQQPKPAEQGV